LGRRERELALRVQARELALQLALLVAGWDPAASAEPERAALAQRQVLAELAQVSAALAGEWEQEPAALARRVLMQQPVPLTQRRAPVRKDDHRRCRIPHRQDSGFRRMNKTLPY